MGPPRRVVRRDQVRLPARHHHDGQGHHQRRTPRWARDHAATRSSSRSPRARRRSRTAITFAGHPVAAAVALANIEIFEREDIIGQRARATRASFRRCSNACATSRSSATCAATGYFRAIELVSNQDTKETFTDAESEDLLRGFLSPALYEEGLICRADDRGDPVIQLSPAADRGPRGVRRDRARPAHGARRGRTALH